MSRSTPFDLVAGPFAFTEGPTWDGTRVLFTDMVSGTIHAFRPWDRAVTVEHRDTGGANGLALDHDGRLIACEDRGRRVVRYEPDGSRTVVVDAVEGRRLNSPNDVVVTSSGSVWFTDPFYGEDRAVLELGHESVYEVVGTAGGGWAVQRRTWDTTRPNGLAFSPDEGTLYVAESPRAPEGVRQLRAYPMEDGTLGSPCVLAEFGPHRGVDGMCVLDDGSLVVTCGWSRSGPGGRVMVLDRSGAVLDEVATPGDPTNVCLGGPDRTDLYLTGFDGGLWCLPGFVTAGA